MIQLTYPDMMATVVGSWHWPFPRKDVALYGERGCVITHNDRQYALRIGQAPSQTLEAKVAPRVALSWLAATVRNGVDPVDDPSSLANNLVVMSVLEAARRSAAEQRVIPLSEITASNGQ